MDTPSRQLEVGVSEIDYAFEELQSRTRDGYLGDSFNNRPAVSMPRRRARRHGTMMSEKQSMRGWNNHTTDESASVTEEEDERLAGASRPHVATVSTTSEYHEFILASKVLEKRLGVLIHTVQQLGSALVLSRACRDVRNELCNVRKFFENTAARFLGVLADNIKKRRKLKHTKRKNRPRDRRDSALTSDDPDQNEISDALDSLYGALDRFLTAIRDFEDYSDRDGEQSLENFMEQVGILSGCLSYFGADGDSLEFPRFVYEKTVAMKRHLEQMDEALGRFVDIGVPCISFAQKRSSKMLLNAATVATFFAGVAATVLQFSIELNDTPTQVAANTLWFASLVLSIGSAINGLLAMTWRQAVFSSPKRQQPWFIRFWTRQGYLVLLVVSVLTFLGGLLCYMHETQKRIAFWISAGCTAFCVIGLANVSVWFGMERWDFTKFRRTLHPSEVEEDSEGHSTRRDLMDYARVQWFRLRIRLARLGRTQTLPTSSQENVFSRDGDSSPEPIYTVRERLRNLLFMVREIPARIREYTERKREPSDTPTGETALSSKSGGSAPKQAHNTQRSQSDLMARTATQEAVDSKLLEEFVECVRDLKEKQSGVHQNGSRVKHMQFSPCGKWLVVCYQFSCVVYRVGARIEYHQQLRHTRRSAKQVEWSPDGKRLLTRLKDTVRYWALNENQEFKVIDTLYLVRKLKWIRWLNDDEFLALTEDNYVQKVSLVTFKVIMRELPRDLTFHEVYPMDKGDIVLFIATHYFDEKKETYIDCIIVYDLNTKSMLYNQAGQQFGSLESLEIVWDYSSSGRVERKIPLLHDVESLTVCDDGEHVVVSYEENSPEVWKYLPPRDESADSERHTIVRLTELVVPEEDSELCVDSEWGDALFMGPSNEIIACPADDRVYMWNRHSKECIHALSVGDGDEDDVPEFAWFVKAKTIVMASASGKNGSLKLWTVGGREGGGTGRSTPRQARQLNRPQTPPVTRTPPEREVLSSSPTEMTGSDLLRPPVSHNNR